MLPKAAAGAEIKRHAGRFDGVAAPKRGIAPHAPALQMRLHAQRHEKAFGSGVDFLNGAVIEMVTMTVRNQHGADCRQFGHAGAWVMAKGRPVKNGVGSG